MKLIMLTNGGYTKVSDEDYDYLIQWYWYANTGRNGKRTCIRRTIYINSYTLKHIFMHHEIADRINLYGREIDHIDRDPTNNQRNNLREATNTQNQMNTSLRTNNTSDYKGVSYYKNREKWVTHINIDGKKKTIGYFDLIEQAAVAYDLAAIREYGDYAYLNFPDKKKLYLEHV